MPIRSHRRLGRLALGLTALGGCVTDRLPPLTVSQSRPGNLIERSLVSCAEKSVEVETACLRSVLASSRTSVAALVAMVPGCRLGQNCTYDYTTDDRVGYLPAYATHQRYGFHIAFDLTKYPKSVAEVPLTLTVL